VFVVIGVVFPIGIHAISEYLPRLRLRHNPNAISSLSDNRNRAWQLPPTSINSFHDRVFNRLCEHPASLTRWRGCSRWTSVKGRS
jgi:hypothetical protein